MGSVRISERLVVDDRRSPVLAFRVRRRLVGIPDLMLVLGAGICWLLFPGWAVMLICLLLLRLIFIGAAHILSTELEFHMGERTLRTVRRTPFGNSMGETIPFSSLSIIRVQGVRPRWALKYGAHHVVLGTRSDARALIERTGLREMNGVAELVRIRPL